MKSKIGLSVVLAAVLVGMILFFKLAPGGAGYLWNASRGGQWLLPLVLVASLLDSVNPCAFSVLLLTIAFLFSLGRARGQILKVGGFYIFGLFTVYLLIGLGIVGTLHLFNTPHFMARAGAIAMILLGLLNLINHYLPGFPIRLGIPQSAHQKMGGLMERASLPAAFVLGGLVGLCEFPCTGGPYLLVLGLLHDQGTYLKGLGYLVLYNLIFILPLWVVLALSSNQALLTKVQEWKKQETKKMHLYGGLGMIALGLLILLI